MNDLERWYRVAMWAYPPSYRQAREDELIGTLLDAHADRRRPSLSSLVALVRHGVAMRVEAMPDAARGFALGAEIASGVVIVAAVSTIVLGGRLGAGGWPGSPVGALWWATLMVAVVVVRCPHRWIRWLGRIAVLAWTIVALDGGPDVMGAYRAFLLAVAGFAVFASFGRPRQWKPLIVSAVIATVIGLATGVVLTWRIVTMFSSWDMPAPPWETTTPWMWVDLSPRVPFPAMAAIFAVFIVTGWRSPRIGVAAAVIAVPTAAAGHLLARSVGVGIAEGLDLVWLAVLSTAGAAVAVLMLWRATRHANRSIIIQP